MKQMRMLSATQIHQPLRTLLHRASLLLFSKPKHDLILYQFLSSRILNFNMFLSSRSTALNSIRYAYGIYFMKGLDKRTLTPRQQEEVSDFIKRDPLSPSFIVYNRTETLRKIKIFREKMPWVNLFYAMKANPIDPLLRDVIQSGCGIDCASRAEIQEALNEGMFRSN